MWSIFLLIFLMLCAGFAGWLFFLWAVKSGQYDDIEGPKYRMLDDEDDILAAGVEKTEAAGMVTRIEGNKVTVQDAMGRETTVDVNDVKVTKVGDKVKIEDGPDRRT